MNEPDYLVKMPRNLNMPAQYIDAGNIGAELAAFRRQLAEAHEREKRMRDELKAQFKVASECLEINASLRRKLETAMSCVSESVTSAKIIREANGTFQVNKECDFIEQRAAALASQQVGQATNEGGVK